MDIIGTKQECYFNEVNHMQKHFRENHDKIPKDVCAILYLYSRINLCKTKWVIK